MKTAPVAKPPVMGPRHKKNLSLVGFDPLLTPSTVSTTSSGIMDQNPLSWIPSPPILSSEANEKTLNPFVVSGHQQTLVSAHQQTHSFTWQPLSASSKESAETTPTKQTRKSTNRSKDSSSLSPLRPSLMAGNVAADSAAPPTSSPKFSWPKRKQGKGHRRTKSVAATPTPDSVNMSPYQKKQQKSFSANVSPVVPVSQFNSMSPMIQELLKLEQETGVRSVDPEQALFMPSLAKPRPTSFLTGQEEVIGSSEQDATAWQLDIPSYSDVLTSTRLCQFMETYRAEECLLDLQQLVGIANMDLARFARGDTKLKIPNTNTEVAECHRKIVESLLECGSDISEVKGFFTSNDNDGRPDRRREVLIVERQNRFLCVFRGTKAEQQGKFAKQPDTVELQDRSKAAVFEDRYSAFAELRAETFQLLDKLTEDNPFCDISFTGHSFGAAMATLAAYCYANTRTALRVSCCVSASPKVGQGDFRWAAHSCPNLNMWQLENTRLKTGHIGHSMRLTPPTKNSTPPVVQAFKFGGKESQYPSLTGGGAGVLSFLSPTKQKDKMGVNEYVSLLEGLDSSKWVKDFYHEDGAGVKGKDNEARQMA